MGDVNADEIVNIQDLVTVAIHFGEVYEDQPGSAPQQVAIESARVKIGLQAGISSLVESSSPRILELTVNSTKIDGNCQLVGSYHLFL